MKKNMDFTKEKEIIENAFANKEYTNDEVEQIVKDTLKLLQAGSLRVAEKNDDAWIVHEWVKKAILLSFAYKQNKLIPNAPGGNYWYDKLDNAYANWSESDFANSKIRSVPGSFVREGSYVGKNVVLMPSFVNIGAYIDDNTMIDSWATIGSCAQIGKNCHISGGVGIGGVIEPVQAAPVIIEDDCFIGARSEIAEGIIVKKGAVISMGVFLSASTKIIDRQTGEVTFGVIPEYSVIIPGSIKDDKSNISLACAVIVKKVDEKTRKKTSINMLLRS